MKEDTSKTQDKSPLVNFKQQFIKADQLCKEALQNILNQEWEDVDKLHAEAKAMVENIEGEDGVFANKIISAFIASNQGVATKFRIKDPDRDKKSIIYFEESLNQFNEIKSQFPEKAADIKIDLQIMLMRFQKLIAQGSILKLEGEKKDILAHKIKMKGFLDGVPNEYQELFQAINAPMKFAEISMRTKDCINALHLMELERALAIITDIQKNISEIMPYIINNELQGVIIIASKKIFTGFDKYTKALDGYIRVLYEAVVGEVTSNHIVQLKQSEGLIDSSVKSMSDGITVLNSYSEADRKGYEEMLRSPLVLIKNLRSLCQESFKPKNWFLSASFKFIIVFILTAVILFGLLYFTDSNTTQSGFSVGFILLLSFICALIGGYGFDSLRFLPFVKHLTSSPFSKTQSAKE